MTFCKLLKYDLRQGIGRNWWKYPILMVCILIFCILAGKEIDSFGIPDYSGTDIMLIISGGMKEYIPSPDESFQIPIVWICLQVLFLIFDMNYCAGDLETTGSNRMVKCENRRLWWLSKCCWLWAEMLSFWFTECICVILYCLVFGCKVFAMPSKTVLIEILKLNIFLLAELENWIWVWILPFIFIMTLGFLIMLVSMLWKPIGAFLGGMVLLIVTLYVNKGIVFLNQVMPLRSSIIVREGYSPITGVVVCGMAIAAIIGLGFFYIKKCNILPRED